MANSRDQRGTLEGTADSIETSDHLLVVQRASASGGYPERLSRQLIPAVFALAMALHAISAPAQTARDVKGATPLIAIQNEPPAKLIVDPPIPGQLALGRVFIQYRTENLRILPVFGKAALDVSPRVGHLHYYVDDQSWPIVDTSGETVVLVGLAPGPHKVKLELADPTHKPIPGASAVVEFTVPAVAAPHH
jgi:hypothetical protein